MILPCGPSAAIVDGQVIFTVSVFGHRNVRVSSADSGSATRTARKAIWIRMGQEYNRHHVPQGGFMRGRLISSVVVIALFAPFLAFATGDAQVSGKFVGSKS